MVREFSSVFRRVYGYAVEPHLDGILRGCDPQAQHDYWQLGSRLYQQWFANNHAWCQANGLCYTFHTSDTGPLTQAECQRSSVFSEGDPFTLAAHCDCPGTDHEILLLDGGTHYDRRLRVPKVLWGAGEKPRDPNFADTRCDLRAKYAASSAFMTGRQRVMCEMFAACNFSANYQDLRRIAAWQVMQGINFIVPHAVHHRFHGSTKFFAPPEFLHGPLHTGLREFNDWLAHWCAAASCGSLCAAVAVIDPTAALWRGNIEGSRIFALCDRLNRSGCGYVIVTPEYAHAHAADFALVIDPETWDGGALPDTLPGSEIRFSGGELHYMRRRMADGTDFLLVANIWSEQELTGQLHYAGREIDLVLAPGELAQLGGAGEQYRRPQRLRQMMTLPTPVAVDFDEANVVPLECWTTVDGSRHLFCWYNRAALPALRLDLPAGFAGSVSCDGMRLDAFSPLRRWDDCYQSCALPAIEPGWHELEICGELSSTESPMLVGEFDVALTLGPASGQRLRETYNLTLVLPETAEIELSPRRSCLNLGTLAAQGHVFYAGKVTYHWEFDIPVEADAWLVLPEVSGVCDVSLDGQPAGRAIFAPCTFPLSLTPDGIGSR